MRLTLRTCRDQRWGKQRLHFGLSENFGGSYSFHFELTSSHSSSGNSAAGYRLWIPPQLTSTSILPPAAWTARSNVLLTESISAKSHSTALCPEPGSAFTAGWSVRAVPGRTARTTVAPASAKARAQPAPMPRVPPVTRACFPWRLKSEDDIVSVSVKTTRNRKE